MCKCVEETSQKKIHKYNGLMIDKGWISRDMINENTKILVVKYRGHIYRYKSKILSSLLYVFERS